MVSLYRTDWSPAGEGHVAFVLIREPTRFGAVCCDNRAVLESIRAAWIQGRGSPFDCDLAVLEATFTRTGDSLDSPSWVIRTPEHWVEAQWSELEPPVVAYRGTDRETVSRRALFNVLMFARKGSIRLDGQDVPGKPYLRDIWRDNLGGGDRSSCVFALAETFVVP